MDKQLTQTFQVIEECGKAAETLSKTLSKFGESTGKLQKSVERVENLDEKMRENESLEKVLDYTKNIKKIMDQLHKNIPAFSTQITKAYQEVSGASVELENHLEQIREIMPGLTRMADVTTEIHDISKMMKILSEVDFESTISKLREHDSNITKNVLEQDGLIDSLNVRLTETDLNMEKTGHAVGAFVESIEYRLRQLEESIRLMNSEWKEQLAITQAEQVKINNQLDQIKEQQVSLKTELTQHVDDIKNDIKPVISAAANETYEKLHQEQEVLKKEMTSDMDSLVDMQEGYFDKTQEMINNLESMLLNSFSSMKRDRDDITKKVIVELIPHMEAQERRITALVDNNLEESIKDYIQQQLSQHTEQILKEIKKPQKQTIQKKNTIDTTPTITKHDAEGKVFTVSQLLKVNPPFTIQKVTIPDKNNPVPKKAWTPNYVCTIKRIEGNRLIGTDYKDGLEHRTRELVEHEDQSLYQIV